MEYLTGLMLKLSINNYDIGSKQWVDVTHINNPDSFYVRPTICRSYMATLNCCGDQILATELKIQQNVVYKSKLLNGYVRGKVMFILNNNGEIYCDLYALDNGFLEKDVSLKRIRKAFYSQDVPPLVVHCQLADCKPIGENGTWTTKVIECMKFYVGNEQAYLVVRGKTPNGLVVELMNSCPDDLATMLAYGGYTTFGYGNNVVSRFSSITPEKHYFSYNKLNIHDELHVRVQCGDSLKSFYVAQVLDYKQYLTERGNFTSSSKNQNALQTKDVKVGLPVGVFDDTYNKYERAIITEITVPDSRVKVQLVDWGKIWEVPYLRLKPMTEFFFNRPAMAIYCAAEESQIWDNGLHKFLYPGYEFKITVVSIGHKFESPSVVKISPIRNK